MNAKTRSKTLLVSVWYETGRAESLCRFVLEDPLTGERAGFLDSNAMIRALRSRLEAITEKSLDSDDEMD